MAAEPERVPGPLDDGIGSLLDDARAEVAQRSPSLLPFLEVYLQEARITHVWIAQDLARLSPGARILEVGAGLGLVSCQLVREGFDVVALEPVGEGFSEFGTLREIIGELAARKGFMPELLCIPAEELSALDEFDFAFSSNVMEHVKDVRVTLRNIVASLRPGASYRFNCPNYLFPYEPHFDIPTLLSKRLTGRVFARTIRESDRMSDPAGVWKSLNWITVPAVARALRPVAGVSVAFDRTMLERALRRMVEDPAFAARRSPTIRRLARMVVTLGLHRVAVLVPASLQPIMDCLVSRRS